MTPTEYRKWSRKVEGTEAQYIDAHNRLSNEGAMRALHMTMGIAGEGGELVDAVKKTVFYGKPLDRTNVIEELGDLMWYIDGMCDVLAISLEEVMSKNVAKLQTRYKGEGFSNDSANVRDLDAERQALEDGKAY